MIDWFIPSNTLKWEEVPKDVAAGIPAPARFVTEFYGTILAVLGLGVFWGQEKNEAEHTRSSRRDVEFGCILRTAL